jgi:hypothetical protein
MNVLAGDLQKLIAEVDSPLGSFAYPFPHPRGQLTVLEYARYGKPCQHKLESVYQESNSRLERLFPLHYRLLGRLLVAAEIAEKDLEQQSQTRSPSKLA